METNNNETNQTKEGGVSRSKIWQLFHKKITNAESNDKETNIEKGN